MVSCRCNHFVPCGSQTVTRISALHWSQWPPDEAAAPVDHQRTDVMKILFASTPATGHLNPLLAITRVLLAEGHEITFLTGTAFRSRIESCGAEFLPLPPAADFDPQDLFSLFPELKSIPPGPEWLRIA